MKHRKLRIAWSVWWGVMAVFLIVLWVRSPYSTDYFNAPLSGVAGCGAMSRSGGLGFILSLEGGPGWLLGTFPTQEVPPSVLPYEKALGFVEYLALPNAYRVRFPYWFLVSLTTAFAAAPWIPRRYSLRTLLILTTLMAVILGAIAFLNNRPAVPPLDVGDFLQEIN